MNRFRNFTNEEVEYIKQHYFSATVNEIAECLNKKPSSVYNVIHKLGILKQPHNKWTEDEINFLKNNYIEMTSEEISNHINHSIDAINTMRDKLGLVRNPSWTDEEVKFLVSNFSLMSHNDIGEWLGKTQGAITAKCFDLNLYKKEKPWEQWELDFVKDNYMEMSKKEISEILDRSFDAIQVKANRMGLKKSPYFCDYHYFDVIDTEEKAYWLGFLTADGWISKSEKTNAGVTGIELQYGDIGHLKKFNKSIKGNYQIVDRWKTCPISTKDPNKKNHMCIIRIFSLVMYESLRDLGFSNNKSYDFGIPKIQNDLIRHYIRGYFDGDGCLCFTNKSFKISFTTASRKLSDDVTSILKLNKFKAVGREYINDYNTIMYVIDINYKQDKIKFLDWIYSDCNIYLDRKYKKYLKVKNTYMKRDGLAI